MAQNGYGDNVDVEEIREAFDKFDRNQNGRIEMSELKEVLEEAGVKITGYEAREIIDKYQQQGKDASDGLEFDEFVKLYSNEKSRRDPGSKFTTLIKEAEGNEVKSGATDDIKHSIRDEEKVAFSDWINSNLSQDPILQSYLPINSQGDDLYEKCRDGIVICKLINHSVPDTVDERALHTRNLNRYKIIENNNLALNSSMAIGCHVVNIGVVDLAEGKPHLVLGLLWQIIRKGLFSQIDLVHVPGLVRLLFDGETLDDLRKLTPEEILKRWVNYHLNNSATSRRIKNFDSDITDSEIYTYLLDQIAPKGSGVGLGPLQRSDKLDRAEGMLQEADKIHCRAFVQPMDVVKGIQKLNLAFVANLFNTYPALDPPDEPVDTEEFVEETREEKTYRNWMNSMGVNPYVNWIYSDLCNGIIIFQLYDIIKPGVVNWKRVNQKFVKMRALMDQIENCNYAVELGQQLRFSLVGIQGKDIYDGNRTLTLGLVWQLMRAYTLTVLASCTGRENAVVQDKEIIEWVNTKLSGAGKESQIRSFQDKTLSDSKAVMELIDAIQPDAINWENVKSDGSYDAKLANAKYAISMARRIGAKVYALPEDIVEVKPKMVLTVFACLMARDFMPDMGQQATGLDGRTAE